MAKQGRCATCRPPRWWFRADHLRSLGSPGEAPIRAGADLAGLNTGIVAAPAVVAALLAGVGQQVEVSALGTLLSLRSITFASWSDPDERIGFAYDNVVRPRDFGYTARDRRIDVATGRGTNEHWAQLLLTLGLEDYLLGQILRRQRLVRSITVEAAVADPLEQASDVAAVARNVAEMKADVEASAPRLGLAGFGSKVRDRVEGQRADPIGMAGRRGDGDHRAGQVAVDRRPVIAEPWRSTEPCPARGGARRRSPARRRSLAFVRSTPGTRAAPARPAASWIRPAAP